APFLPTLVNVSLTTCNAEFSIGALPSAGMSRAPSNTVTPVADPTCVAISVEDATSNTALEARAATNGRQARFLDAIWPRFESTSRRARRAWWIALILQLAPGP